MGIDADLTFGTDVNSPGQPVAYSGITVNDRDPAGGQVYEHNPTGHGSWQAADPYATAFQGTSFRNPGFAAPNYLMSQPRPDGVSDGTNIMQGVRVYDPSLRQWATPDAYFVDGEIEKMAAYEDLEAAQAALRRHVLYDQLLSHAAKALPGADEESLNKIAFGSIDRTRYAGSVVYEVRLSSLPRCL